MDYILKEKPKNPVIIQGFPSFGLVSTIATGFLIDHLDAKPIGEIIIKNAPPMLAIHNKQLIKPIEIYYSKKENLVIVNALTKVAGKEWELSDVLLKMSKDLNAKEIIILEGIATQKKSEGKSYYYSSKQNEKLKQIGLNEMNEGIIMGVPASLLVNAKTTKVSCIFTETNPNLPDNRAAAKVIEKLDNYLNLKVDYRPLIKKAQEVESKLKSILSNTKKAFSKKKRKDDLSYLG